MKVPTAKKIPHTHEIHGDKREDPFFWLREKDSEDVLAYLKEENAYTDVAMAPTKALQEELFHEIKGRIKLDDESVPQKNRDGWWYFTRTLEDKQYPIFLRKESLEAKDEQVCLDVNELAKKHEYVAVAGFEIPRNEDKMWYTVDTTGYRQYQLCVRNLSTGEDTFCKGDIFKRVTSFTFVEGRSDAMWFVVEDEKTKRNHQLYFWEHDNEPRLVYEERDERFQLAVSKSSDYKYIIVQVSSHTTTENFFADSRSCDAVITLYHHRKQDVETYIDHRNDTWYKLTNDKGKNFQIVDEDENVLMEHDPDVMIEGMGLFKDHIVAVTREEGISSIQVAKFSSSREISPWRKVEFPEDVIECGMGGNPLFDTDKIRVGYTSLTTPGVTYDCDLETLELTELKRREVLGAYNAGDYIGKRFHAKAKDGTNIPLTVVHHKDTQLNGTAPALLEGYGSYGVSYPITFSYTRLSYLNRGFVYAIAHVRGGGERGKKWHDEGRMKNKINTFTDFITCGEFLVENNLTSPRKLCIEGASAGGLLIGAVLNMRTDLFGCAVLDVPFLDVLTTMSDDTLPLVVGEYEEWGDPKNPAHYERLKAYCPYTNLEPKDYPPILVITSYNDSQVMYWEPTKYVAKLRSLKTDDNTLLLKCPMEAGHGGKSGRDEQFKESAFVLSFFLNQLGLVE